jgi:tight adherence protein B
MLLPVFGTFALVAVIIIAAYFLLILKPEQDEQSSLRRRMKAASIAKTVSLGGLLKEDTPLSTIPFVRSILASSHAITAPTQRLIDRSGLKLTVATLLLMCLCAAMAGFLLVQSLTHFVYLAVAIGILAMLAPIWVITVIAGRRVMKFEEQFPEAIDLLARALRAGHAFTSGLSMVAEELPAPVGTEFRLAYDRQNFGMPLPAALKELGERVPLLDAKFFVTAVLTQRDAGGNLSEVLDNLASVIRERFKVKRQVRVVTAHARMTGWVLALLPPGLGVALTILSPENMSVLWTDPLGIKFLVIALILQIIGTLIIRKLVDIEY